MLTTRIRGTYEVGDRYERHLLLVDYQLASLRFAFGLHPQEDYYARGTRAPVRLEGASPLGFAKIAKRFQAAKQAIHTARRYAQYLDGCFESTWRLEEIRERAHRLNAVFALSRRSSSCSSVKFVPLPGRVSAFIFCGLAVTGMLAALSEVLPVIIRRCLAGAVSLTHAPG